MLLKIHFQDATPPYLQIVEQISRAVASGHLPTGEALPSIRRLAEKLQVNRNTVDKAYRELEHRGVVEIRRGKGAFVLDAGSPLAEGKRVEQLRETVDGLAVQAHHLRIADDTVLELVAERLKALRDGRDPATSDEEGGNTP